MHISPELSKQTHSNSRNMCSLVKKIYKKRRTTKIYKYTYIHTYIFVCVYVCMHVCYTHTHININLPLLCHLGTTRSYHVKKTYLKWTRVILEAQFCGSSSENELNSLTWLTIIQRPPDALGHILTKKKRRGRSTS